MSYIYSRKPLLLLILNCGLLVMTATVQAQRPQMPRRDDDGQNPGRQGRLAAPQGLKCDTDHTTSFTGQVLSYDRKPDHIFIRVRTDEATTEEFNIPYAQDQNLSKLFRLNGQSLGQGGLAKIESRWKRVKNARVTIWACYDEQWRTPSAELIDWKIGKRRPPETL